METKAEGMEEGMAEEKVLSKAEEMAEAEAQAKAQVKAEVKGILKGAGGRSPGKAVSFEEGQPESVTRELRRACGASQPPVHTHAPEQRSFIKARCFKPRPNPPHRIG